MPFAGGDAEADLACLAWYAPNGGGTPHPVETKAPNAWGLYDMHGNVFEWCQDWEGPYPPEDTTDPLGPEEGEMRILRGGCFKCPPPYCRSANRYAAPPDRQAPNFGCRVLWAPDGEGADDKSDVMRLTTHCSTDLYGWPRTGSGVRTSGHSPASASTCATSKSASR